MKKAYIKKITIFVFVLGILIIAFWQLKPVLFKDKFDSVLSLWEKSGATGKLTLLYPRDSTMFPPELPPPTFKWKDKTPNVNLWLVVTDINGKIEHRSQQLKEQKWQPDSKTWDSMKNLSTGKNMIRVTVLGVNEEKSTIPLSGQSIVIQTSTDRVGAFIFYRDVPLPFEFAFKHLDTIRWRLGDISSDKPTRVVLEKLSLCGNCHSFTRDGQTLAMDVDYANDKGSYVISNIKPEMVLKPDQVITWSDYRREDGEMTFGLLSQISPGGRYVLSTVKDRSIFVPIDDLFYSQLFFPIKGIIAVYDRETKKFWSLPGANNPSFVQSNPSWSPDGKNIIFARTDAYRFDKAEKSKKVVLPTSFAKEFIEGKREFKYSLYKIPFNDGKGGEAMPIPGASNNGKSNYFPRISPDGKWMVFCKADNFMLLQPDSKLYIMPARGGTPREMNCNTKNMNSWHAWSPNGKWLVFASKEYGAYTQLFLTHIDENGQDTPPVLLENFNLPQRAINIPEFVNINDMDKWHKVVDNFSDDSHYYVRIGEDKFFTGDLKGAVEEYNKALQKMPNSPDIYIKRADAKAKAKDFSGALQDYNKALEINSRLPVGYKNRGNLKLTMGKYPEAIEDYNEAIRLNPDFYEAYDKRGNARFLLKDFQGASQDLNKAITINPNESSLYSSRAFLKANTGDLKGALEDYNQALKVKPEYWSALCSRADIKVKLKDLQGALADYSKAIQLRPEEWKPYYDRANARFLGKDLNGAIEDFTKVIQLKPDFFEAYDGRANMKSRLNDLPGALEDINRAIRLKPDHIFFYINRGELKFQLKDFDGAIDDFDSALKLNPKNGEVYYKRGMVKIISGQREKGCQDLARAQQLGFTGARSMIEKHCSSGQ